MDYPRNLFAVLFLGLILVAAGCSGSASSTSQFQPVASAKTDTDSAGPAESIDHSSASQPRTVTEQPRAVASRPVPKAKPSRDIQRTEVARNGTPNVAAAPAPVPPPTPTLTLPAPVPPAVDT